jgi:hypothetical protein
MIKIIKCYNKWNKKILQNLLEMELKIYLFVKKLGTQMWS